MTALVTPKGSVIMMIPRTSGTSADASSGINTEEPSCFASSARGQFSHAIHQKQKAGHQRH